MAAGIGPYVVEQGFQLRPEPAETPGILEEAAFGFRIEVPGAGKRSLRGRRKAFHLGKEGFYRGHVGREGGIVE